MPGAWKSCHRHQTNYMGVGTLTLEVLDKLQGVGTLTLEVLDKLQGCGDSNT